MRLVELMFRVVIVLTLTYIFSFGANFSGSILPDLRFFNLSLLTIAVIIWGLLRWRRGWKWHTTPLDLVFVLWITVIFISLLANQEAWRRSLIGIWYVGLYLLLWYLLADVISHNALKRDTLIDGFLFAGLVVIGFGFLELSSQSLDLRALRFPRPGSLIGNPNSLGAFLIVCIGFAGGRVLMIQHKLARTILSLYILMAGVLLFLTFSRGAWIGAAVTLMALGGLWLRSQQLLSVTALRLWWFQLSTNRRIVLLSASTGILLISLLLGIIFIRSLSISGRSVELRTRIWGDAITMFTEQPLIGHGLFNFGREFERLASMPPSQPHSHAHNVVLLVAAELGLVGLIVMALTVFVAVPVMDANWRDSPPRERAAFTGAYAAVLGFGVHHLLDTPFMMPLIALSGLLALLLAVIPVNPVQIHAPIRLRGQTFALAGSALILLMTGYWSTNVSRRYTEALGLLNRDEYLGAAQVMQNAINADPYLSIYHEQQAYIYGLVADRDPENSTARMQALAGYERFLELEPQSATGWTNYGALLWQSGEGDGAIGAMQTAVESAPDSWQLALNLGAYLEASGQDEASRDIYQNTIDARIVLLPFWEETLLRQEIASQVEVSAIDRYLLGDTSVSFDALDFSTNTVKVELARLVNLLSEGASATQISAQFEAIERFVVTDVNQVWLDIARAEVLRAQGDVAGAEAHVNTARERLRFDVVEPDFSYGSNIGNFQFLRIVVPRSFLPEVYYPIVDPLILRLLDE